MAETDRYGVQFFIAWKGGGLAAGRSIICDSADEARRLAERRVAQGYAAGAAAFVRTVIDPEYDDGEEPITLATFGRVPAGVRDQIPF